MYQYAHIKLLLCQLRGSRSNTTLVTVNIPVIQILAADIILQ